MTAPIRTIFGAIGNVISICLFLSPGLTCVKIIKWKNSRGFAPYPYVVTGLSCALWVLYGLPLVTPGVILVLSVNAAGLVLQICYTLVFLLFIPGISQKMKLLGVVALSVVFFAAVATCSLVLQKTQRGRQEVIGIICIIFNIGMYASPLVIMKKVIKEKSVKYLPLPFSMAQLANGSIWLIYSLFPLNINILVPNAIGTVLAGVQVTLYVLFYKTTNWDEAEPEFSERGDSKPPRSTGEEGGGGDEEGGCAGASSSLASVASSSAVANANANAVEEFHDLDLEDAAAEKKKMHVEMHTSVEERFLPNEGHTRTRTHNHRHSHSHGGTPYHVVL